MRGDDINLQESNESAYDDAWGLLKKNGSVGYINEASYEYFQLGRRGVCGTYYEFTRGIAVTRRVLIYA